jgi:FRG domain-containing protein
MGRKPRWEELDVKDGVGEVRLFSWRYFHDYITQQMLDFREYIWRGQRCDNWLLEPTLDRHTRRFGRIKRMRVRQDHLKNFKYAARGRRGSSPPELTENDWWALGQHHGLDTPLLDWTSSPFAAAYFAFYGQGPSQTTRRAVYALHATSIQSKSNALRTEHEEQGKRPPPIVELVRPLSDDNPRLVNQGGLFTRAPDGVDLETWIGEHFVGDEGYTLMKLTIPKKDRTLALRSLNRMNINHLTLFPDLYGASRFCNLDLVIDTY